MIIVAPDVSIGRSNDNFVRINDGGVTIVGSTVKINSGGRALGAWGNDPNDVAEASKADPSAPTAADDAKSGQKSS